MTEQEFNAEMRAINRAMIVLAICLIAAFGLYVMDTFQLWHVLFGRFG